VVAPLTVIDLDPTPPRTDTYPNLPEAPVPRKNVKVVTTAIHSASLVKEPFIRDPYTLFILEAL